jgi:monofunctional biosynthetic peptidoglycan transglycosylase
MRYRLEEAQRAGETLELRHEWVPLEEISSAMQRAVILAEDGNFREHHGVDWEAIAEEVRYDGKPPFSLLDRGDLAAVARAARYYLANRDEVRGRSTITQQLAKNLYFTPERSLTRKVSELVVAQRLEWFMSKDRILELYLNTVELGPGVFGVEAAAQEYFGSSAAELTSYQAASLAGTLPHPLTSNPSQRPSRMAWRRDIILARMTRGTTDRTPVPVAPEVPTVAVQIDSSVIVPLSADSAAGSDSLPVTPPDTTQPVPPVAPVPPVTPPVPPDTARSGQGSWEP